MVLKGLIGRTVLSSAFERFDLARTILLVFWFRLFLLQSLVFVRFALIDGGVCDYVNSAFLVGVPRLRPVDCGDWPFA